VKALHQVMMSLFLSLLLTSCAERTVIKTVYLHPPSNLLEDTKVTSKVPKTMGELKLTLISFQSALQQCNIDKQEVRKYGLAFK